MPLKIFYEHVKTMDWKFPALDNILHGLKDYYRINTQIAHDGGNT
jgi:hypothetical protein